MKTYKISSKYGIFVTSARNGSEARYKYATAISETTDRDWFDILEDIKSVSEISPFSSINYKDLNVLFKTESTR